MLKKIILIILIALIPVRILAEDKISERDSFLAAKAAYDQQDYVLASELLGEFAKKYPGSKAGLEAQFYLGRSLFEIENFVEARNVLTKLENSYAPLKIENELFYWLGQVHLRAKDYAQAAKYFKKVIDKYPDSDLVLDAKMQLGDVLFKDGKLDEAEKVFSDLAKFKNINISEEALFKKGEVLHNKSDYNSVLKNYKTFTEVFLDSDKLDSAYFYMGQAAFNLEDYTNAVKYYSQAKEVSQNDLVKIMSHEGIAWSYLRRDNLDAAKKEFLKLKGFKGMDYNRENIYFGEATLYFRLNELDRAIEYYDKLINTYPATDLITAALFGKAQSLNGLLRLDEAKSLYLDVIKRVKESDEVQLNEILEESHYNLGWVNYQLNDFESAVLEFKRASEISSNKRIKVDALVQMGKIYQEGGKFDSAADIYSQILRDFPDYALTDYIQYQLGIVLLELERFNEAVFSFRMFNENFSGSDYLDDVNYYLAFSYFKNGELKEASERFQKFLEAFTTSAYRDRAMYLLGVCFKDRGMYKEALSALKKTLKEFGHDRDLAQRIEYEIASVMFEMGQEDLAADRLNDFIKKYPKSELTANVIFWLGQFHFDNAQYGLSKSKFEQFIRKYPDNDLVDEARYQISLILLAEGKSKKALQSLERTFDASDKILIKLKIQSSIGELLLEEGKKDEALNKFNNLIELASSGKIVLPKKDSSLAKFDSQDDQKALAKILRSAYVRIGELHKQSGKFKEAISSFREAEKYSSLDSNARLQFNIAECFEEVGNFRVALDEYLKIPYQYQQDEVWVVKGLLRAARLYEDKQEWRNAVQTYEKVLDYDVPEKKHAEEKIEQLIGQMKTRLGERE